MKFKWGIRLFLQVSFLGFVPPLGWSQGNDDVGYDYRAEGNAPIGALITRYYQPTDEENEQLRGMTRASYEAWIARGKSYLRQLETTIDYEALKVAD